MKSTMDQITGGENYALLALNACVLDLKCFPYHHKIEEATLRGNQ
jgi:hypothetical protein